MSSRTIPTEVASNDAFDDASVDAFAASTAFIPAATSSITSAVPSSLSATSCRTALANCRSTRCWENLWIERARSEEGWDDGRVG